MPDPIVTGTQAEPRQISQLPVVTSPATQLVGSRLVVDITNPAYVANSTAGGVKQYLTRSVAFEDLVALLQGSGAATNAQRGTPKIVLSESSTDAGVGPNDSTLDRLANAVLCVGTTVLVLKPEPHQLVLAKDPTGPLTVATDGNFSGPTTSARWLPEAEAFAAGEVAFSPLTAEYAAGARVNYRIAGVLRLFSAATLLRRVDFPGNIIPVPGSGVEWEEVSPPVTGTGPAGTPWVPLRAADLNPDKQEYANLGQYPTILKMANALAGLAAAPAAPTAGQVDDIGDLFSFLPNPLFPSFAQYKANGIPGTSGAVVLDANNSYTQGGRIYVKVPGAVTKQGLAVYVAGSGNRPDGSPLVSDEAFTGVVVPPVGNTTPDAPIPNFDATTRALTFQHALGTSELEINRLGGAYGPYAPVSVDDNAHTAGEWKARVKAYVAGNRNASGTADSPSIAAKTVAPAVPTISGASPNSAAVGSQATLTGTNFATLTAFSLNGTPITVYTVNSATSITFTVPAGATTGIISLTTAGGTATSTGNFTVATGTALPVYALTNARMWDNGLNLDRDGYVVRNPYSSTRFTLPAGVSTFDIEVFHNLPAAAPYDALRSVGVFVLGGTQQSIAIANTTGSAWYPVTVAAGSTVSVWNGFLEKAPGQDYDGIFVKNIRLAGVPTFVLPAPPLRRALGYGDSILAGAFGTPPELNTALNLVRAELPTEWRVTFEAYSARKLADDYAEASDRPAFIARLSAALDGTSENVLISEIGTNDDSSLSVFAARLAALLDDLHAARPDVRVVLQAPTVRTDFDITTKQDAVMALVSGRAAYVSAFRPTVTTAQLAPDGIHLRNSGHRSIADQVLTALVPAAPVAWQAMTFGVTDPDVIVTAGPTYAVTDPTADFLGNVNQGNKVLAAGAVGGLRCYWDGVHQLGIISATTAAGSIGYATAEASAYFGSDGAATNYVLRAVTGSRAAGGVTDAVTSQAPNLGSYMRLWRYPDGHLWLDYSADGINSWIKVHDYGLLTGVLRFNIDVARTETVQNFAVVKPETLGLS